MNWALFIEIPLFTRKC